MHDIDNEFDLLIKQALDNAAIKPSRRVWKNVSSQISDKTIVKPVLVWPKWVGATVAFASLLVCAILFVPKSEINPYHLADNNIEFVSHSSFDGSTYQLASLTSPRKIVDVSHNFASFEIEDESPIYDKEIVVHEDSWSETTDNQIDIEESTIKLTGSGENASRFFNQLAYEDSKQNKNKISNYYIRGSIGSNDGLNAINYSKAFMAPGNSTETEIKEIEESSYAIPFSLGLGARLYLHPKISLGTGLNVNILNRSFIGKYQSESGQVKHSMVYLGIPLNIYYDIHKFDNISLYTYAGTELEYCISNKYTLAGSPNIVKTNPVKHFQASVTAGIGVELFFYKNFGVYLDPGVQYYFPCNQPKNVRSVRPLIFNFDAGLRFNF